MMYGHIQERERPDDGNGIFPAAMRSGRAAARASQGEAVRPGGDEDAFFVYLREMGRIPRLTETEERRWAERALAGDTDAKHRLIEANLRLVVRMARRFMGHGLSLLDLIQEGNIGLMHAAELYDYRQGTKFGTYAYWWIQQSMSRAVEERGTHIHIPSYANEELRQVQQAQRHLLHALEREPHLEELVQKTGMDAERIVELQRAARVPLSLEEPVYGDQEDLALGDVLPDSDELSVEEQAIGVVFGNELDNLLKETLTRRERLVVRLRFGLGNGESLPLVQVGKAIGLSHERARQIEAKAFNKLRGSPCIRYLYESL